MSVDIHVQMYVCVEMYVYACKGRILLVRVEDAQAMKLRFACACVYTKD
jgi:hypothetical protein